MGHGWKIAWISLLGIVALLTPASVAARNGILSLRHWVAPDHTRVVLDVSPGTGFRVERQGERLFIDLDGTEFPTHLPGEIKVCKPNLEAILLSAGAGDGVRLTLCLPAAAQANVFALNPYQDKPHRIVIDIVMPELAKQQSEARGRVRVQRKDRIVVIDPGHGGEAVGAVGKGGLFEKDAVLAISRRLRDLLNRQEGYRAFLTRDGDYYVSFKQRLAIAREYGADIFVSIHADAAVNRAATGASVYSLSMGGASSEAAKILARDENLADLLGGVPNGENNDASDPILLDMFQTHTINQSRTLGEAVLKHLEGANRLKFPVVQEAPFRVLKLPQIPSVLIETAYISNPREEKLLKSPGFQGKIAEAVAASIRDFIPPLPAVAQLVEAQGKAGEAAAVTGKSGAGGETVRVVKAAAVPTVAKANPRERKVPTPVALPVEEKSAEAAAVAGKAGREGEAVRAVKAVAIPAVAKANPRERKVTTPVAPPVSPVPETTAPYQVKRGDTLGKIAYREGTSIAVLLRLNGMKLADPLPAGRTLRVPAKAVANREPAAVGGSAESRGVSTGGKPRRYRVQKGDSLTRVAEKQGTTVTLLAKMNALKVTDQLVVGRILRLPPGSNR